MIDESEQLERLRGSMSKAVEKGEFEPYLQFVVDRAGTVVARRPSRAGKIRRRDCSSPQNTST